MGYVTYMSIVCVICMAIIFFLLLSILGAPLTKQINWKTYILQILLSPNGNPFTRS